MLDTLFTEIQNGRKLTAGDALNLCSRHWSELAPVTEKLRKSRFGNRIDLCTILNAKSGACDMNCAFCSQSAVSESAIEIYPLMSDSEIEAAYGYSADSGASSFGIVTSGGRLDDNDIARLGGLIEKMVRDGGTSICGSLGRLRTADLLFLKSKGMDRIHHNLESSKDFYSTICSSQSWISRLETIRAAQQAGMKVCAGGLFGMGESWEDRIALALTLRENGIDSVPLNFLIAHDGTAMAGREPMPADEALLIIAVYRLLLPEATIRICGGRSTILAGRQRDIFKAGANALMTGNYLTSAGTCPDEDREAIPEA